MFIKVKVKALSTKDKIEQKSKDQYVIFVKEKALENKANRKACELLASYLGLKNKDIRIIRGHKKPNKLIEIREPKNI